MPQDNPRPEKVAVVDDVKAKLQNASAAILTEYRGLMPNPKAGTVTFNVGQAVKETKAGKIEFRVDKGGNVHVPLGKVSFALEALESNFQAFMDQIIRSKPSAAKGVYVRSLSLSSTMGPGVAVDTTPYR